MEYQFSINTNIDAIMTITGLTQEEFLRDCPKYDPFEGYEELEGHFIEYDFAGYKCEISLPFTTADGEAIYCDCCIDLYDNYTKKGDCRLSFNDELVKLAFQRMIF